jgi:hypothetical protein
MSSGFAGSSRVDAMQQHIRSANRQEACRAYLEVAVLDRVQVSSFQASDQRLNQREDEGAMTTVGV